MARLVLVGVLIAAASCAEPAAADDCDALTAQVVRATGAVFKRRASDGQTVFLTHPSVNELTVKCRLPNVIGPGAVSAGLDSAFPPEDFFTVVGLAGEVSLSVPAQTISLASKRCHSAALKSRKTSGEINTSQLEVTCNAYRDADNPKRGNTSIVVYPSRKR